MKNIKSFGVLALVLTPIFFLQGCDEKNAKELEAKGTQTFQNALQDSGLQETLQSHKEKIQEFLDSNQTQQFLDNQTQILQQGINQLGKVLESNETKAILQQQMKNLNEILGGKKESVQ